MSLTIKPVPLFDETKYWWWVKQTSSVFKVDSGLTVNGLIEVSISLHDKEINPHSLTLIALTDVIYNNKVCNKKGTAIRFYSFIRDRYEKDFKITIDIRPVSAYGSVFDTVYDYKLLKEFKCAMFIKKFI